jgi:hypothetical protein
VEVIIRLDEPNLQTSAFFSSDSQYLFLKVESLASATTANDDCEKYRSILNRFIIHGTPEQLKALIADEIYRACKKEDELPQSTADDEAAKDFERLQQARANTPEANMELSELEEKINAA